MLWVLTDLSHNRVSCGWLVGDIANMAYNDKESGDLRTGNSGIQMLQREKARFYKHQELCNESNLIVAVQSLI